jgi:hypothetical protein
MHSKVRRALLFILMVGALFLSGQVLHPIVAMRVRYQLTSEPVKGLSPELALATQMLGWGRGILIDIIWIRLESLKEQGRYFELVQLADWACKLSPRDPDVWDFHAWNLAYNVSCEVEYMPDRWAWLYSGIKLWRDEGIPRNPKAYGLYDRLAFTYYHKIGMEDDNAHMFYKATFAEMMHDLLRGPGTEALLRRLADMPRSRDELLLDPAVARIVERCDEFGFDVVGDFYSVWRNDPEVPHEVMEILENPVHADTVARIADFACAWRLREEERLDPEKMLALMERYGPFDWRSPFPHAVYWATEGLRVLDETENLHKETVEQFGRSEKTLDREWAGQPGVERGIYEHERINMQRLIYGSLQSLVKHGRLLFDSKGRMLYVFGSDYRFVDPLIELFDQMMEEVPPDLRAGPADARKFFLERAAVEFYILRDLPRAKKYYDTLAKDYPTLVGGRSFEKFVDWSLRDRTVEMTYSDAREYIRNFLVRAYSELAINNEELAAKYENLGKQAAIDWNASERDNLRVIIRYDQIKESVLVDFLTGVQPLHPEVRANLARRLESQEKGIVNRIIASIGSIRMRELEAESLPERYLKDDTPKPVNR